eukprot:3360147-Amphidinium_carterae.1
MNGLCQPRDACLHQHAPIRLTQKTVQPFVWSMMQKTEIPDGPKGTDIESVSNLASTGGKKYEHSLMRCWSSGCVIFVLAG